MSTKKIIQVDEKVPANLLIPLSLQHTFAMFGASVLVPIIFGIDPSIVLLMNGLPRYYSFGSQKVNRRPILVQVLPSSDRQASSSPTKALSMRKAVSSY